MKRQPFLLHHLLEDAAERDPDSPALTTGQDSISYGELETRSRSLAGALVETGVKRGDRVGILANRGIHPVIGLYGVMMAGGVYVPLDPTAPASRLGFMVDDCGIEVIVSEPRKKKSLEGLAEVGVSLRAVVGSGEDQPFESIEWDDIDGGGIPDLPGITELDPCYLLYTSGSTGTPKGIVHSHRSALSWAEVSSAAYELTSEDVVSNCGPLHFDQSTFDIFSSARAGATTAIVPEDRMKLPASFLDFISDQALTVLYTVPTTLVQLAASGLISSRQLPNLRLVLFGGEPMPSKHLRALMEAWSPTKFVNVYGPTEVNGVTHHTVGASFEDGFEELPIGLPYDNVEMIVVDEGGSELGDGDLGELCARTPTMMLGYWGKSELDKDAYLEQQIPGMPPKVFYRTGDLGVRSADGLFHFRGRRDRQVKVRGFRIELDEVESALLSHEDVAEAAVFVESQQADSVMHATVVVVEGSTTTERHLSSHLRRRLPPHALPAIIEVIESMPRTTSGKIDRRKLQSESAVSNESAVR